MALKPFFIASFLLSCISLPNMENPKYDVIIKSHDNHSTEFCVLLNKMATNFSFRISKREDMETGLYLRVIQDYENKTDYHLSYLQLLKSVECIFQDVSDNQRGRLHCLEIDISSLGEEAIHISNTYINQYGSGNKIKNDNLLNVIRNSNFITDLQKLLFPYGYIINNIELEMPFLINKDSFLLYKSVEKSQYDKLPNKIIKAVVYINISDTEDAT